MERVDMQNMEHIHFIGIGGISMSGLARMCLAQGKDVSGSDRDDSAIVAALREEGATVGVGHAKENVSPGIQLVVYSAAVPDDNPELTAARERGISTMTRAQFLGEISRGYYTIAVAGTHGKTTTSAMMTKVLKDAGLDPTALVGSIMTEYGSNYVQGRSKYLVVEACEYERQFLELEPQVLIITNIEEDHLDYYKDIDDICSAFRAIALKVPEDGVIVYNGKDVHMGDVLEGVAARTIDFNAVSADGLALRVPGQHNKSNAQAVLAICSTLGVGHMQAVASLNEFRGTWRRFEYKGAIPFPSDGNGRPSEPAVVYDDYAHHPTAVRVTLAGAKEMFPDRRIVVVFQPHLYSRTHDFLEEFAQSFTDTLRLGSGQADEVIIADIYPAREKPGDTLPDGKVVPDIHARDLVEKIKKPSAQYVGGFDQIVAYLKKEMRPGDIIITMGAGDIYKIGERMIT